MSDVVSAPPTDSRSTPVTIHTENCTPCGCLAFPFSLFPSSCRRRSCPSSSCTVSPLQFSPSLYFHPRLLLVCIVRLTVGARHSNMEFCRFMTIWWTCVQYYHKSRPRKNISSLAFHKSSSAHAVDSSCNICNYLIWSLMQSFFSLLCWPEAAWLMLRRFCWSTEQWVIRLYLLDDINSWSAELDWILSGAHQ
jgi:hypothetical protein